MAEEENYSKKVESNVNNDEGSDKLTSLEFGGEDEGFDERHEEIFLGEFDNIKWADTGEYGEGGRYFLPKTPGEGGGGESVWEEGESSSSSEVITITNEIEETEEEKEMKREMEALVEEMKQKAAERMPIRRKNAFLQKKLVEHFKRRRMDNVLKEDPKGLDLEGKYLKRLFTFHKFKVAQEAEIEEITNFRERYEQETKVLEEDLNEKVKNFISRAKEVSLNLILTKTGKKLSEKAVDHLLKRQKQKNEEKGKKKLQYIKLKNLIDEKEHELRVMEYFGEGLHVVDYEQMKIDNQNYADKIEEKEDELSKMRLKTQAIMLNLAQVREKAYAVEGDIELMEEKVYEVEKKFLNTRESLTQARKTRDSLRDECSRLKLSSGLLNRDALLRDFEMSIYEAKNLAKTLEKLKKLKHDKRKQETQLAKLVQSTISDFIFSPSAKRNQSQRSQARL